MHTRPIPSSGEALPVIGCGTYRGFDVASGGPQHGRLPGVLETLFAAGGTLVDSSPMYGKAEAVVGELLEGAPHQAKAFLATKVWTSGREEGIAQMRRSMALMKTQRMDLMQVHNLLDCRTHLATLRAWKAQGQVRYIGVTHYTSSAYDRLEAVLRAEELDFVQLNYSLDDRKAEQRLLPLAIDRGIAVIANVPFGGGGLLSSVRGKPLPPFARDIGCTTWGQILLKFVLGHPAITCAIPGTGDPQHMAENASAGTGTIPDEPMRRRIAEYWKSL